MKKMIALLVLTLFLTVSLAGSATSPWFTARAELPGNTFTAAAVFSPDTIPLSSLSAGNRVVDTAWSWIFKSGNNYSDPVVATKPVVWLVVGIDHYGPGTGVLLLAEEVIAKRVFDTRGNFGNSIWKFNNELKPWLNGTFYDAFSDDFKEAVLTTTIPHQHYLSGGELENYTTDNKVFILSETELGITSGLEIGTPVQFFIGATFADRRARLGGSFATYWTRSPADDPLATSYVRYIRTYGDSDYQNANIKDCGYRPALTLKGNTRVEPEPIDGIYRIIGP